jgi:hypothetical protein
VAAGPPRRPEFYHCYFDCYCSYDDQISFEFIKEQIFLDSKMIFAFAKSQNISGHECVLNNNLEIYQVSSQKINSFDVDGFKKDPLSIYQGIYDPRINEVDISTILISNQQNIEKNKIIFSHELSHYWFDRLCWDKSWGIDSESFARKFEEFYKERIK